MPSRRRQQTYADYQDLYALMRSSVRPAWEFPEAWRIAGLHDKGPCHYCARPVGWGAMVDPEGHLCCTRRSCPVPFAWVES